MGGLQRETSGFFSGGLMRRILPILLIVFLTGCTVGEFVITDAKLCKEIKNGEPYGVATNFSEAETVYCWIEYKNAPENTAMRAVWYYEGEKMYEREIKLKTASGKVWFSMYSTEKMLPHGSYRVEIYVNDELRKEMDFSITR